MAFERNDIVNKTRLAGELGEELMGFEHNDIVTVYRMDEAIAEGGGGGGGKAPIVYCTIPVSGSRVFGRFEYAKLSGGTYTALAWAASYNATIYAIGVKQDAIWVCPFHIPEDDDKFLVFIPNGSSVEMSGNIADTPVTVGGEDAFIVHGDFSVSTL